LLKVDILALGMLSCLRKALTYINQRRHKENKKALALDSLPREDPHVYEMLCRADSVGVFQVESRAQMSMLPRLKPRCFYDLVIEVALVRPGPIQGNMVHPYLRRRSGLEKPYYPDERVKDILGKTLGVPIFQEQAMRLAIVLAGFSGGEAEQLRRSMAAWKRNKGLIAGFKQRIVAGMTANGYSEAFAESCMNQIKGFAEYGFPESHAASFALLVYASACLKYYYPAEFAAALINSQPMGFYAPAQIVNDLKKRGVTVRPIDINASFWDCSLEENSQENGAGGRRYALRLGFRLIKGLQQEQINLLCLARNSSEPFSSISDLWHKTSGVGFMLYKHTLERLAQADVFKALNLQSRRALWEINALPAQADSLKGLEEQNSTQVCLPFMSKSQEMFQDYALSGLSLKAHPLEFLRTELNKLGADPALSLQTKALKSHIATAGLVICRQRPGSAKGVVFITLEDESGITNLIIKPHVFELHRKIILSSAVLLARGLLERLGEVVYVNTESLQSLDGRLECQF
jgi:error-prone DNA polymerase